MIQNDLILAIVWFQKISIHLTKSHRKFCSRGGLAGLLKKSMRLNWNFQRGEGFTPKVPPVKTCEGSMGIFWSNTCIYIAGIKCYLFLWQQSNFIIIIIIIITSVPIHFVISISVNTNLSVINDKLSAQ